jgi:general stress protein 26
MSRKIKGDLIMDRNEARTSIIQLMANTWVAYLTTVDSKCIPHIYAMDNLRNVERYPDLKELFQMSEDDFWVLVRTHASSRKMNHIRTNQAVCVYYCEPREFCGLSLDGSLEIITDSELRRRIWQDYWIKYFPRGADDPEYTVLSLHPVRANYYHRTDKFLFDLTNW